jgi:hypothetical protein
MSPEDEKRRNEASGEQHAHLSELHYVHLVFFLGKIKKKLTEKI